MGKKKTHNEVALIATRYLKNLHNCPIGAVEFACGWRGKERLDGFLYNQCGSFLVEAKVTRSDFLADGKKDFRITPSKGVGRYRYYACPKGLIDISELPDKWGLVEIDGNRAFCVHGFGRSKKIGEEKHPAHGWAMPVLEQHGSSNDPQEFAFEERNKELETWALFYMAKRYKQQKFMDNML